MAIYASAALEGFGEYWQTGHRLIDLTVTRAQQENSSCCKVVIADPGNVIAAALIEHVEKSGGIQQLPGAEKAVGQSLAPANAAKAVEGQIAPTNGDRMPTGDVAATELSPPEKAFLDLVAYTEGTCIKSGQNGYDTVGGYGHNIKNMANHPSLTGEYDPIADGGFSSDASGRYQFLSTTWTGTGQPDFSPASQDRAAIQLVAGRGVGDALKAGDLDTVLEATSYEWASLPPPRYGQAHIDNAECHKIYNERLAYYQSQSGVAVATATTSEQSATDIYKSLGADSGSPKAAQVFKGRKLIITIADRSFEFFHQGTETDHNGVTTLTGQGGRWVMNRRKRNRTFKGLSLKTLAESVAKEHGLTLDWQADFIPEYEFVDQSGISDYELLLRELKASGLFITEGNPKTTTQTATASNGALKENKVTSATTLIVKSLRQLNDTRIVLARGNNLISYKISDKPLNKEDLVDGASNGTSIGITEPKVLTDMMTGQMKQATEEVDPAKSPATLTGNSAEKPKGTMKPGQEAVAATAKARVKRCKGLPSSFVIPLYEATLDLKPLDVIRTVGLPGKLSRVWMVDSVTHSVLSGTTTLNVFSPVEVPDASPVAVASVGTGASIAGQPGKHVCPCQGIAGDGWDATGATYGRRHGGVDIAWDLGTPVYATLEGTVKYVTNSYGDGGADAGGSGDDGGYGNNVEIVHPDGFQTRYCHLQQGSVTVSVGDTVTQGQHIGNVGNSGRSYGAHLHFQFENVGQTGGIGIDPTQFGWGWSAGSNVSPGTIPA